MSRLQGKKALFKQLCKEICIPLPSRLPDIPPDATSAEICGEIDHYFTDIIQGYPEDIQNTLMLYYFGNDDLSVYWKESTKSILLSNPSATINPKLISAIVPAEICFSNIGDIGFFAVSDLQTCPILFRAMKIHEIGSHLGQILYAKTKYGSLDWVFAESTNGMAETFNNFLEISAAMAEKPLYESIPTAAVIEELKSVKDAELAQTLLSFHEDSKSAAFSSYMNLQHRPDKVSLYELRHMLQTDAVIHFNQIRYEHKYRISTGHLGTYAGNLLLSTGALFGAISCAMQGDLSMAPVFAAISATGYTNTARTTIAWKKAFTDRLAP